MAGALLPLLAGGAIGGGLWLQAEGERRGLQSMIDARNAERKRLAQRQDRADQETMSTAERLAPGNRDNTQIANAVASELAAGDSARAAAYGATPRGTTDLVRKAEHNAKVDQGSKEDAAARRLLVLLRDLQGKAGRSLNINELETQVAGLRGQGNRRLGQLSQAIGMAILTQGLWSQPITSGEPQKPGPVAKGTP